MFWLVRKEKSK